MGRGTTSVKNQILTSTKYEIEEGNQKVSYRRYGKGIEQYKIWDVGTG